MSVVAKTEAILNLARSRAVHDREQLLLGIVDLCEDDDGDRAEMDSPAVQALLSSIFMSLVVEAERDIRIRLAEKLSGAAWAPAALINVLALDDIEIARPIIAASPVLKDQDLIRLLVDATIEHQIEVARRPHLGPPVIAEILRQGEPAVMTALAGNATAEVTQDDLGALVALSEKVVALRTPLSRHPKLSGELARALYLWVGQALRQSLVARFELDAAALDAAIAQSVRETHGSLAHGAGLERPRLRDDEQAEMERRLIAKLDVAGQLRPGYLLRVLREQRLSLFVGGLTTLGRFEPSQIQRAIESDRPELLALACASVGIDRSVFPTILTLVRELNGGRPGGGAEGAHHAQSTIASLSPDIAQVAFRKAIAKA